MFEKSLQDLVKGLRAHEDDPEGYLATCVQEIKNELRSRDVALKAQAVQKLTYLHMLGLDVSWSSFNVVEMMTQERFGYKRIGMLAAAQTFTPKTDVILLTTQQLKRDFHSKSYLEIGIAMNCLANIATEDLARDLLNDAVTMLTSSRPYLRKKAVLLLYKLFVQYPQGLRLSFEALKKRLEDDNASVQSCAVNVICELAHKRPSNYLGLAPTLFGLLTSAHNNWMLIKVVKLLGALVCEEPRLARKLLSPLAEIVSTTPAKSLMYEAIHTLTLALQFTKKPDGTDARNAPAVVRLCTEKLRELIKESDQNLKYLGLVGLGDLMRSNPRVVAEHRDLVLACLLDDDITIRLRSLELVTGMVTRRNLQEVVRRLLDHVSNAEGRYRDELLNKIIFICSRNKYEFLTDFAWYIGVLVRLAYVQAGGKHGEAIAGQLLDVAVRVEVVRPFAVTQMIPLLRDVSNGGVQRDGMAEVLRAAAWITGEYASTMPPEDMETVVDAMLQPATASLLPDVQCVYLQCLVKVLAVAAAAVAVREGAGGAGGQQAVVPVGDLRALALSVCQRLEAFAASEHVEVQERATSVQALLVGLGVPYTMLKPAAQPDAPVEPAEGDAPAAAPPAGADDAAAKTDAVADVQGDDAAAAAEAPAAQAAAEPAAAEGEAGDGTAAAPAAAADVPADAAPQAEWSPARVASVLGSMFAEALKPVSEKAQKKVKPPAGLDLDAVINAEAEEAEEAAAPAKADLRAGMVVNFGDAYQAGGDDAYAGADATRRGGTGGALGFDFAGSDEDDDLFLTALTAGSKGGKKSKKDKKKARSADPFMLGGGEPSTPAARDDVDVPIATLDLGSLGGGDTTLDVGGSRARRGSRKGRTRSSSGAKAPALSYTVAADDDEPEGGSASSDEEDRERRMSGLGAVDLSKPLAEDEVFPERHHRVAGGSKKKDKKKAGKKKKKGKDASKEAGAPAEKKSKKKDKKKDKERKGDAGGGAGAGGAGGAPVGGTPTIIDVPSAAASPAQERFWFPVFSDKVVRCSMRVRVTRMCDRVPDGEAAAAGGIFGAAELTVKVESRSSKKGVSRAALSFPSRIDSSVMSGVPEALTPPGGLGPKAKKKSKGGDASLPSSCETVAGTVALSIEAIHAGTEVSARLTYEAAGGKEASADVTLRLRPCALLVPTEIDDGDFAGLMRSPPSPFYHKSGAIPVPEGAGVEDVVGRLVSLLPSTTAMTGASGAATILFANSFQAHPVTTLIKPAEDGSSIGVTVKSTHPAQASAIVADLVAVMAGEA